MKKVMKNLMILAIGGLILLFVSSCDPQRKYFKEENAKIQQYLTDNPDLVFEKKKSGLYYLEEVVGTGEQAVTHDTAYTFYTAKFLNGNQFDSNVGTTDTVIYPVNEGYLIPGYEEGLTYMKVGGKSKMLIPSTLGYGNTGYYFPAFTPIIFEVHLVRLVKSAK
jgi:FKBP-type peptidyl-prolyl cis-trans isomerase